MKLLTFILLPSIILSFQLKAQEVITPEQIRTIQRSVCAIRIIENDHAKEQTIALGCGVVLMSKLNGKNEYFVATAYHIVESLFNNPNTKAEIVAFDDTGVAFKTIKIGKEYIIWQKKETDMALLVLPGNLTPADQQTSDHNFDGLTNLKVIGEPDWGQDIYLFGYRWMKEDLFLDILKKGILSVGTTQLPGYEGQLVYLIDNMANKGMSGGLAFTAEGVGIGIISSYVYEVNSKLQNSDDLTVCLPLNYYFKALGEVLIQQGDQIAELIKK